MRGEPSVSSEPNNVPGGLDQPRAVADHRLPPGSKPHNRHEHRGAVEIRWAADGDPDDVVAPYPPRHKNSRIGVHIERMDDGLIWMSIDPPGLGAERVVMWFQAVRKNELEWRVSPVGY